MSFFNGLVVSAILVRILVTKHDHMFCYIFFLFWHGCVCVMKSTCVQKYCLLTIFFIFSEKCIKKLSEKFGCYADKLHEPEVYDFFMEIISNVQKTVKPEVKSVVEELEKRIVDSHEKGVEDENIARKAGSAKLKTAKSKTAKKSGRSLIL